MKIKKMTDGEYLTQYLNEWKESVSDLFVGDMLDIFLDIKKRQFNVELYKKQLKAKTSFELMLSKSKLDDFFVDL